MKMVKTLVVFFVNGLIDDSFQSCSFFFQVFGHFETNVQSELCLIPTKSYWQGDLSNQSAVIYQFKSQIVSCHSIEGRVLASNIFKLISITIISRYFNFVGRVVAKAIYDNKLLECYFTRAFYKHILGVMVTYKDMESEDYSLYQSLVYMLNNPVSDLGYEVSIDNFWK